MISSHLCLGLAQMLPPGILVLWFALMQAPWRGDGSPATSRWRSSFKPQTEASVLLRQSSKTRSSSRGRIWRIFHGALLKVSQTAGWHVRQCHGGIRRSWKLWCLCRCLYPIAWAAPQSSQSAWISTQRDWGNVDFWCLSFQSWPFPLLLSSNWRFLRAATCNFRSLFQRHPACLISCGKIAAWPGYPLGFRISWFFTSWCQSCWWSRSWTLP